MPVPLNEEVRLLHASDMLGPLSDEELTLNAEQIFLELDRQEAASDKS